jgi:hypothetical protein
VARRRKPPAADSWKDCRWTTHRVGERVKPSSLHARGWSAAVRGRAACGPQVEVQRYFCSQSIAADIRQTFLQGQQPNTTGLNGPAHLAAFACFFLRLRRFLLTHPRRDGLPVAVVDQAVRPRTKPKRRSASKSWFPPFSPPLLSPASVARRRWRSPGSGGFRRPRSGWRTPSA